MNLIKTGYVWNGWSKTTGATDEKVTPGIIIEDINYYGSFSNKVTATLWSFDNSSSDKESTAYIDYNNTPLDASIDLGEPTSTPDTFSFRGWSTDNSTPSAATVTSPVKIHANAIYYATYQQPVTVTFYYNNTSSTSSRTRYKDYLGTEKIERKYRYTFS